MGESRNQTPIVFETFAEAISSLEKFTKIESKIAVAIDSSRVPWRESRKLLKCMNPAQASNTSLFQFIQTLFLQIGLGKLEILEVGRFQFTFCLRDCEICKLYRAQKSGKICFITSDALLRFFVKDLDLPCSVEETKCIKEGSDFCEFKVDLQPLGVYKIALDAVDGAMIEEIIRSKFNINKFAEDNLIEEGAVEYRLQVLESYQIIDKDRKITEIGSTYQKFAQGLRALEEDFDPPWKSLQEITSAIAAKDSFAEAMCETLNPEPFLKVDKSEIVNLTEEAKKSKSFAELISKYVKLTE
jgi:predicted hydrocarbon binding protein